ncbi:hypothetical protein FOZ62_027537 [Perkinsus olseni]|uniref:Uncharacterized protein n=1 Tax=Perkinsus olseni TaxID=32597 RepID=A0A7J6QPU8_PEROL|nr:hypothetical protein FOZ62_027537 [Perkinsus olseni]
MSLPLAALIPEEISTVGGDSEGHPESPTEGHDTRFNTDNADSVVGARLSATTPCVPLGIYSAPPKLLQDAGKLAHQQQPSEPSPSSHRGYNIQFDTSVYEYPSPPPASCSPPLRREEASRVPSALPRAPGLHTLPRFTPTPGPLPKARGMPTANGMLIGGGRGTPPGIEESRREEPSVRATVFASLGRMLDEGKLSKIDVQLAIKLVASSQDCAEVLHQLIRARPNLEAQAEFVAMYLSGQRERSATDSHVSRTASQPPFAYVFVMSNVTDVTSRRGIPGDRPFAKAARRGRSLSCTVSCLPGSHTRARSKERTAARDGLASSLLTNGAEKPRRRVFRSRPSVILRMKPRNLNDTMAEFFESRCSKNPVFEYDGDPDDVFERHSTVDCSLLEEAQRILDRVLEKFGSSDAYLETAFGSEKVEGTELRSQMEEYLAGLGLLGVVTIKTSSKLLSIANVVKTPPDKHVLHLTDTPVPAGMIPGLCAHEIGTHLLRMLNNDLQPWRADRCLAGDKGRRIKLANHFATEEGLATLNALVQSEKRPNSAELFLWSPALRYWATVQGQNRSFVQLFELLERYVQDPIRRFKLCSRVKRGIRDTGVPVGACTLDQAYFLGAVDILRHLESIDFVLLYCGLLSRKDLHRVRFCARRHAIRLPQFLGTIDRTKKYIEALRKVARVNQISIGQGASSLGDCDALKRAYSLTQTKSYFRRRLLRDLAMKVHYDRSRRWCKQAGQAGQRKIGQSPLGLVRASEVAGQVSASTTSDSSSSDEVFEVLPDEEKESD